MKERAFRVFTGICLVATLYGAGLLVESQTNLASGHIDRLANADLLIVDTPQSREVLGVATRVINSADKLSQNPLNREILNNMVRVAMDDAKVDVASLVDVERLATKLSTGNEERFAADASELW